MKWIGYLLGDEEGASAVEYSLMLAAVTAVIVTTVYLLGVDVFNIFNETQADISSHMSE